MAFINYDRLKARFYLEDGSQYDAVHVELEDDPRSQVDIVAKITRLIAFPGNADGRISATTRTGMFVVFKASEVRKAEWVGLGNDDLAEVNDKMLDLLKEHEAEKESWPLTTALWTGSGNSGSANPVEGLKITHTGTYTFPVEETIPEKKRGRRKKKGKS